MNCARPDLSEKVRGPAWHSGLKYGSGKCHHVTISQSPSSMVMAKGKSLATTFYPSNQTQSNGCVPINSHSTDLRLTLYLSIHTSPPTRLALGLTIPLVIQEWQLRVVTNLQTPSPSPQFFSIPITFSSSPFFSSIPTAWRLDHNEHHSLLLSLHFWSFPSTPSNTKAMF